MKIILEKTYQYDGEEQVISKSLTLETEFSDHIHNPMEKPDPNAKDPIIVMLEKLLDLVK